MTSSTQPVCIGLSYRTAPLELRERLAFGRDDARALLTALTQDADGPSEAVLLHTCHRTEFYMVGLEPAAPLARVAQKLEAAGRLSPADEQGLREAAYVLPGDEAVTHLLRVAAGLDSMVVGESQILGQVREAATIARGAGTTGPVTERLFVTAVRAGRRARAETDIGRRATSIPAAAVELARRRCASGEPRVVVVIGAGKTGLLAAKALMGVGVRRVIVSNRSYERAVALANEWGGCAVSFDGLPAALAEADVVISSTSAPHTVVGAATLDAAMGSRPEKPMVIVDIAVPRDVEPAAAEVSGVHLYTIDDLESVVSDGLADRSQAIPAVEAIVAEEAAGHLAWCAERDVEPTIAALHRWAADVRESEVERSLRRLSGLPPEEQEVVRALATALVGKLMHPPTAALKAHADDADGPTYAAALRELFDLHDPQRRNGEGP